MRRGRNRSGLVAVVGTLVLVLSGCGWVTWGNGAERQGNNRFETVVGTANVAGLHHLWSVDLGAFINASPVLAVGVPINGTPTDVVYVGTEHGDFYAVSTAGRVLWTRNLGSHLANCPDTPDSRFGVQASAIFDAQSNRVYVAGGDGKVYALNPSTGAILSGWPVTITTDAVHEPVYSAPTLWANHVYVETASHCDRTPYHGRIVSIDTATRTTSAWYVSGSATGPNGGGIWSWGGASVDPADGNVYVATGNVIANPENLFYGDHVVRLTGSLQVVAAHSPGVGIVDDDFGSTPVLFQKPGCPRQLVTEQKNGSLYLYDRDSIASGYRQKVTVSGGGEFIGVPAYSPDTQMVYVANPVQPAGGAYTYGMIAFRLDASCKLVRAWEKTAGTNGSITSTPTVANGVVYYGDGGPGHIHGFNALTGTPLWTSGAELVAPVFAAPIVANGKLFAGAYDHRLHAWGL